MLLTTLHLHVHLPQPDLSLYVAVFCIGKCLPEAVGSDLGERGWLLLFGLWTDAGKI